MACINLSKGSYSVDLYVNSVSEEYKNKLITLSLSQSASNQSSGKKDTKIIDLLRITHQFIIKAHITSTDTLTAKQVKDNLKAIANGGGTSGGTVTLTYDGDSDITGYIETLTFTNNAKDYPSNPSSQFMKYECSITFVVGTN